MLVQRLFESLGVQLILLLLLVSIIINIIAFVIVKINHGEV